MPSAPATAEGVPATEPPAQPVAAAEGASAAEIWKAYGERWKATADYTASFRQSIEVADLGTAVASSGRFSFAKPDLLLWEYTEGAPQTVVGDGAWVWVYQPDLEQVYKIAYAEAFGSGGLVALLAGRDGLSERYEASLLTSSEQAVTMQLVPRAGRGEQLEVTMTRPTFDLAAVVITDAAGSTTRMEFFDAERNGGVDPELFSFTPPAGVDIIHRR